MNKNSQALDALLMLALVATSCSWPRTQTILLIDADQTIRSRVGEIRVEVENSVGARVLNYSFRPTGPVFEPLRVPITSRGGDENKSFYAVVRACENDCATDAQALASARVRTGFARGRVLQMHLWLLSNCPVCEESQSCTLGDRGPMCIDVARAPSEVVEIPRLTDTGIGSATDASRPPDAGTDASIPNVALAPVACGIGFAPCPQAGWGGRLVCCASGPSPWTKTQINDSYVYAVSMGARPASEAVLVAKSARSMFYLPPQREPVAELPEVWEDCPIEWDGLRLVTISSMGLSYISGATISDGPRITFPHEIRSGVQGDRSQPAMLVDRAGVVHVAVTVANAEARETILAYATSDRTFSFETLATVRRWSAIPASLASDQNGAVHVFALGSEYVASRDDVRRYDADFGESESLRFFTTSGEIYAAGRQDSWRGGFGAWTMLPRVSHAGYSNARYVDERGNRFFVPFIGTTPADAEIQRASLMFEYCDAGSASCTLETIDTLEGASVNVPQSSVLVTADRRVHIAWSSRVGRVNRLNYAVRNPL